MTVQIVTAPNRVEWSDFEVLKKSPVPGMVAQTAFSMQPQHIHTTSSDDGTHIDKLTLRVDLVRAQCWVVRGAQSNDLLTHERFHYRIAILVARELDAEHWEVRVNGWEANRRIQF